MLPKTYIRIPKQQFLDDFWPTPALDSSHYRARTRQSKFQSLSVAAKEIMKPVRGKVPADALAKVVRDYKLAPGFKLSISVGTAKGNDRWGQLDALADTRPAWAKPQICVRFCSHDPFRELELPTDGWPQDDHDGYRKEVLVDITTRVEELFTLQILTAAYVLIVHESTIRLSRWDRSGTVFSRKVNYAADSSVLSEVFWRITMLTDVQLGLDPTATPIFPGSEEYDLMERLSMPRPDDFPYEEGAIIEGDPSDPCRIFKYVRDKLDESLHKWQKAPFVGFSPRWKLSVPTEDGGIREFLVGPPFNYRDPKRPRVDARNGRAYIAIDCATEKIVFLKDAWRYKDADHLSEREGIMLKRLNDAGVPYVPTVLCEAELPDQKTQTPLFLPCWDDESEPSEDHGSETGSTDDDDDDDEVFVVDASGGELVELHHYRMVVSEVCFPIYEHLKQVVSSCRPFGML
ncbi:hypothetical protein K466DRAFT_101932 [Polyporus arcularius HHB13444]|uniref:Fungal-type protein kinase domain-containing protein n=1 Tax=Polyporus arcularius HHB13444 TaxID=1314778 RepID=A0A5C3PGJ7_9APHY|nr:hypothetical protein K466DRAFT_101932 [Polyporus arcularius HHB13444]